MPVVIINMMEGRSDEQKRELVAKVTNAVCESINSTSERVRVIINEIQGNNYAIGGKLMQDIDSKYIKNKV
jgi:4-oxalocrotonate tautomerase